MAKKGWRNHYREGMPASERFIKDIRSLWQSVRAFTRHGRVPVIVAYPEYPSKRTTLHKIAQHLGYRLTNKPISADLTLFFHDATLKAVPDDRLKSRDATVNLKLLDISKQKVEEVHQQVFGYGTFVDPLSHEGEAVEKSDANAAHDGRYIHLPISEPKNGCVYQRILDNRSDEGMAVDIRMPIMGKEIPLAYLKHKQWDVRFTNKVDRSELYEAPEELFSETELDRIRRFCGEMKAEFCELDIIRDRKDGRIYIIDVNPTPYGPPAGLSPAAHKKAVHLLATAFKNAFLS